MSRWKSQELRKPDYESQRVTRLTAGIFSSKPLWVSLRCQSSPWLHDLRKAKLERATAPSSKLIGLILPGENWWEMLVEMKEWKKSTGNHANKIVEFWLWAHSKQQQEDINKDHTWALGFRLWPPSAFDVLVLNIPSRWKFDWRVSITVIKSNWPIWMAPELKE